MGSSTPAEIAAGTVGNWRADIHYGSWNPKYTAAFAHAMLFAPESITPDLISAIYDGSLTEPAQIELVLEGTPIDWVVAFHA